MTCIIKLAKDKWPDKTAIINDSEILSYAELDKEVELVARQIFAQKTSDTLILPVTGSLTDIIRLMATQRIGRCSLPVNPKLPDTYLSEILFGLKTSQWPEHFNSHAGFFPPRTNDRLPANWILTSGSTALPKVAVISFANHLMSAQGSLATNASKPGDRYLQSLPLFHVGGLAALYRCFLSGASLVMDYSLGSAQWLIDQKITHISLVPTQLQRLLSQPIQGKFHFKQLLLGGGPISKKLLENQLKLPIQTTYGMTEMSSQIITRDLDGNDCLLAGRDLKISDEGEILVKGNTLFMGYQLPSGNYLPVDEDGWFHTRDMACWQQGNLQIIGRLDNQFISGGENIQPETIEEIIIRHPNIEQAVIVPIDDADFGKRPVVFINPEFSDTLSELNKWLDKKLPSFMKPIACFQLPKPQGLKINRIELKLLAENLLDDNLEKI